jgi:hypothetical protein
MKPHNVDPKFIPAGDEQLDLVELVTAMLVTHNHPEPAVWVGMLPKDVIAPPSMDYQRYGINSFWRTQLGFVPGTFNVRYCMVDEGPIADWARLFESEVIPCIVKNNLPHR